MLAKKYRLNKKKDFDRVFQEGKAVHSPLLSIRFLSKKEQEVSRFGIMVSNKVDKKAVVRNQIKRRLRAVLFNQLLVFKQIGDFVIIVHPEIKQVEFKDIEAVVIKLFKKI